MADGFEGVQIGISRGGVTMTRDGNTDFLLYPAAHAVVRNIQSIAGYLVVVRWEHLETVLYTFSIARLDEKPGVTRFTPSRPLLVTVDADGCQLVAEDPATEPVAFDIDLASMPDSINFPSLLRVSTVPSSAGGVPMQATFPDDGSTGRILITAYAGFGICLPMNFDPSVRDWLEGSGAWAQIFARGGGELGRGWHRAGAGAGSLAGADDILTVVRSLRSSGAGREVFGYGFSHGATQLLRAFLLDPTAFDRLALWSPAVELCEPDDSWPQLWCAEYGDVSCPDERTAMVKACPTAMLRHVLEISPESLANCQILILSSTDDDRVPPAQIAEFSSLLSIGADVRFHQVESAGHAGLHDNVQSAVQRQLLWDFLTA
ncbi:S9 family peptidase [Gordonibacter sp. Marseille-P4307]|uniref:alpha/beta hydrolase family protein n=1 Tax=Gordonibacter sp. Marseille-P4307 TaxID=2161815 RepID=UPI000F535C60|nr:prolyl oligopeptidase family serine peptidase [Gordonibacter sp. Marseille-P4307]